MGWVMTHPMAGRETDARIAWPRSGEATAVAVSLFLQNPCDPKTECDASKSLGRGGRPDDRAAAQQAVP